jgi:NADH-quinone oxidoreductase subunit L
VELVETDLGATLSTLLGLAWLIPLASFAAILFFGPKMGPHGRNSAWVATGAIGTSLALSLFAFGTWMVNHPPAVAHHGDHGDVHGEDHGEEHGKEHDDSHANNHSAEATNRVAARLVRFAEEPAAEGGHGDREHGDHEHDGHEHSDEGHGDEGQHADSVEHGDTGHGEKIAYSGDWYALYRSPSLVLSIGWYIDSLTVLLFVVVTFIATCIHVYATGYMHDELHDVTDHEVTLAAGGHLHRPGRFPRFFQALSLFCFSMLGIVIAGNLAMVFIFWELVGICSWFLIGFYFERKSASTAANKAFIVNRVGDFGMLIGLMALWGALGTLHFGDTVSVDAEGHQVVEPGLFSLVRPAENGHALQVPDGMVVAAAANRVGNIASTVSPEDARAVIAEQVSGWRAMGMGNWLLVVAGLGIFCGCMGKSAQVPLHVWLPDAMEGPTPVSALVHSATMVAAGVYLTGRFYPVLTPDVLVVIAYIGAITLFIAATIALVCTDIKRVLAYSTVSQLGYMMLALGVGGWVAGLFHLVTHAFFKSLLFMCSGSVIHACHTNDMRRMGGLLKKMPYTGWTMLVGCLAIIGAGVPFVIGFSGYYSKDSILAQALLFRQINPSHAILWYAAAGGAALTAFYMFRLWFMTFIGEPRDQEVAAHVHESPSVMTTPLVVLSVMAVAAGWSLGSLGVVNLLEQARPLGTAAGMTGGGLLTAAVTVPAEAASHAEAIHVTATWTAFATAGLGVLLAAAFYVWRVVNPAVIATTLRPVYVFLENKWYFDEIYNWIFVKPAHGIAMLASANDRGIIDSILHLAAWLSRQLAAIDAWIDRFLVDGLINTLANVTWTMGLRLRHVQTGRLRQYVMFIVVGTVAIFLLASMMLSATVAIP